MNLLDKVALVTGGARRLGREICLALAREGCDIVIHYRSSRDEADALAREIRGLGRQVWSVCGDFSNVYEPAVTMRTAWELAGWVDVLVNNASAYSHESTESVPVERLEELWRVNALAPMLLAREMQKLAAESRILPADYCGRVVNLFALEAAPRFSVNAVAPGPVLPPDGDGLGEAAGPTPLAIRSTPGDVADAVCYLARAVTVTGQVLYVDGGQHLL